MEPEAHNEYSPPMELPAPQAPELADSAEQPAAAPESRGTQAPPINLPLNPVASTPASPTGPMPAAPTADDPSAPTQATSDLIADDADLIEKEWVTKAKAIVAQTKNDPYQQNRAMSHVKADYLKKRYNKDLKVSEA